MFLCNDYVYHRNSQMFQVQTNTGGVLRHKIYIHPWMFSEHHIKGSLTIVRENQLKTASSKYDRTIVMKPQHLDPVLQKIRPGSILTWVEKGLISSHSLSSY